MRRVLVTQSNYIPWKGYFENIALCDVFVVYDDMQYTKRDWRNRNLIKTRDGLKWLTIPVEVKGRFDQAINRTRISDHGWRRSHLEQLRHAYAATPSFDAVFPWLQELYGTADQDHLTDINVHFIKAVCMRLGIGTEIIDSREFDLQGDRTAKLLGVCRDLGADEYLTGPAAKAYMDQAQFEREGVRVIYANYAGYPEYPQLHPPFEHGVCIWDVLFNCGDRSRAMVIREERMAMPAWWNEESGQHGR